MAKTRNCKCCGKLYIPYKQERFCMRCFDLTREQRKNILFVLEEPPKPPKPLSQIRQEADRLGMTYGAYMSHIGGG